MTNNLFISIITPTLNRADMIGSAIESVLQQDYPHFEHIIVDGGSTDGTKEYLEQYPHLKVLISHDRGMYYALNLGLEFASGDIIGFLNSDDRYDENVLAVIADGFKIQDKNAVVGRASVFVFTADGEPQTIRVYSPEYDNLYELVTSGAPAFNAWFFRRSVFERIGKFDTQYRIAGDREFMLRFALSGLHYQVLNRNVYQYLMHAGSMTYNPSAQEYERIAIEHIEMTEYYLQQNSLPQTARSLIQQLHTRDTIKMFVLSIKSNRLKDGLIFMISGTKSDPRWPFRFLLQLFNYVVN